MGLVAELVAIGRGMHAGDADPVVLYDRGGSLVVRVGDVVVKAHATRTDADDLAARVALAADPALSGILLRPLSGPHTVDGRLVTVWPAATTVDPDDLDRAPWTAAAGLLARLHTVPVPRAGVPPSSGPAGVARAMDRLAQVTGPAADAVRRARGALPPWTYGDATSGAALIHGDWHFGQLARLDSWYLIDVDDLGVGDPAWDLARPAALFAVGLLEPGMWWRFVEDYRAAGGPAVPEAGDPWEPLDVPARALVVRLAAERVAAAGSGDRALDDVDRAFVDACVRMKP